MAGKQQIFDYNQENLLNKYNKCLIKQVDLWYIEDKFAIKTEYKEDKALHDYLMVEMLKTDNCETISSLTKNKLDGGI